MARAKEGAALRRELRKSELRVREAKYQNTASLRLMRLEPSQERLPTTLYAPNGVRDATPVPTSTNLSKDLMKQSLKKARKAMVAHRAAARDRAHSARKRQMHAFIDPAADAAAAAAAGPDDGRNTKQGSRAAAAASRMTNRSDEDRVRAIVERYTVGRQVSLRLGPQDKIGRTTLLNNPAAAQARRSRGGRPHPPGGRKRALPGPRGRNSSSRSSSSSSSSSKADGVRQASLTVNVTAEGDSADVAPPLSQREQSVLGKIMRTLPQRSLGAPEAVVVQQVVDMQDETSKRMQQVDACVARFNTATKDAGAALTHALGRQRYERTRVYTRKFQALDVVGANLVEDNQLHNADRMAIVRLRARYQELQRQLTSHELYQHVVDAITARKEGEANDSEQAFLKVFKRALDRGLVFTRSNFFVFLGQVKAEAVEEEWPVHCDVPLRALIEKLHVSVKAYVTWLRKARVPMPPSLSLRLYRHFAKANVRAALAAKNATGSSVRWS